GCSILSPDGTPTGTTCWPMQPAWPSERPQWPSSSKRVEPTDHVDTSSGMRNGPPDAAPHEAGRRPSTTESGTMHVMERILLYSMALIVGLRLLMPDSGESVGSEIDQPPTDLGLAALRNGLPVDTGDDASSHRTLS